MRVALILGAVLTGAVLRATPPLEDTLRSVGLFKNGLVVVTRDVTFVGGQGCELSDLPEPVHGTFWVDSEVPVISSAATVIPSLLDGEETSARITFKNADLESVEGAMVDASEPNDMWGREYASLHGERRYPHYFSSAISWQRPQRRATASPVWLTVRRTDGTVSHVDPRLVDYVVFRRGAQEWVAAGEGLLGSGSPTLLSPRSTLRLAAPEQGDRRVRATIRYLSRGATWAPSYIVVLDPQEERMVLRQRAVIRNELLPFGDAEVFAISGFPNVETGHVRSLMGAEQTLESFFSALSRSPGAPSRGMHTQMVLASNMVNPESQWRGSPTLEALPGEGSMALHWQSLGRQDVVPGESRSIPVAEAVCPYSRLVSWDLPPRRNRSGRWEEMETEELWDCIRFVNPLPFPMTSAPVTIHQGERFVAQSTTGWVSRREGCQAKLTKALDVRGHDIEIEESDKRQERYVAGRRYWDSRVTGTLSLTNYRGETVRVAVRRRFYGQFEEAENSPELIHLKEGVHHVNRLNQLVWEIDLEPGETKTLTYRYSILAS